MYFDSFRRIEQLRIKDFPKTLEDNILYVKIGRRFTELRSIQKFNYNGSYSDFIVDKKISFMEVLLKLNEGNSIRIENREKKLFENIVQNYKFYSNNKSYNGSEKWNRRL